jgi:hypothetical protein
LKITLRVGVSADRQRRDALRFSLRLELAGHVGEAHDGVGVADVEMVAAEGETERLMEVVGEDGAPVRTRVAVRVAQHDDASARGVGDEDVAVRSESQVARILEVLGPQLDLESRRDGQPRVVRPRHDRRRVRRALGVERPRKLVRAHLVMPHGRGVAAWGGGFALGAGGEEDDECRDDESHSLKVS